METDAFKPLICPNCGATPQVNPACTACGFPLYPASLQDSQVFSGLIPARQQAILSAHWRRLVRWNLVLVGTLLLIGIAAYGWWMAYVFLAPLAFLTILVLVAYMAGRRPEILANHYSPLVIYDLDSSTSDLDSKDVEALRRAGTWRWLIAAVYVVYVVAIAIMLWHVGHTTLGLGVSRSVSLKIVPVPKGAIVLWLAINLDCIMLLIIREVWYRRSRVYR